MAAGTQRLMVQANASEQIAGPAFPDRSCRPDLGCFLSASLDLGQARFGYGTATDKVVGTTWQQQRAAGSTAWSPEVFFLDVVDLPDIGRIAVNGSLHGTLGGDGARDGSFAVSVASPPTLIARITASSRSTIQVDELIRATLSLGATGVSAAIDKNKDGSVDETITIPWSDFTE
jgi:hypothetical protein